MATTTNNADSKYISLTGLGQFLNKLKDRATHDDNVTSNNIVLGTTPVDSGLIFPGSSDYTSNGSYAENKGLVLSNKVLKSMGRVIDWSNLTGTTNLNYFTSPGVYTINGCNNSNSNVTGSSYGLPCDLKSYGKFQIRLTVTKIKSGSSELSSQTYENICQHAEYIDSDSQYGVYVRKGNRSYSNSDTSMSFGWTSWKKTDTTYSNATTSSDGLMSATDKTKLNSLSNYSLPSATSGALGGIKIGYNNGSANGKNYPVVLDSNNKAYVNVPWEASADLAGVNTPGIIPVHFMLGSAATIITPAYDETRCYAIGGRDTGVDSDSTTLGSICVVVPWTDTKVTSSTSTNKRYLLGHSSTATTATANTHSDCYMQAGYLYSGGVKVATVNDIPSSTGAKMSVSTVTASNGSTITLSANNCTHISASDNVDFTIAIGNSVTNELTTHMACVYSNGNVGVKFSGNLLWMDGEKPSTVTDGSYYILSAGFYEFIFTKYGGTSGTTANITASWAVYN